MIRRLPGLFLAVAFVGGCTAPPESDDVLSLAVATPYRLVAPRLSGPFPSAGCDVAGPGCPTLEVGSPEFTALAEASNRIRAKVAVAEPSWRSRHALALAELLWAPLEAGSLDASVAQLEELWALEARSDVLSDLGAAYLLRAEARNDASDLVLALDATERAVRSDSRLGPALFNRALILHRLGLYPQALAAWDAYLAADQDSSWMEAASHQRRSTAAAAEAASVQPADRIRDAIGSGDRDALAAEARRHRQWARELVMDELLPEWGRMVQAGVSGDSLLTLSRTTGSSLVDQSVSLAVAHIDSLAVRGRSQSLLRVARGLSELGAGREAYLGFREGDALPALRRAQAELRQSGSPLASWADYWIGAALFAREEYDAATIVMDGVAASTDPDEHPTLLGLVLWVRGVTALREGRYAEAADIYRDLIGLMKLADEAERTGVALGFLAEALVALGRPEEAWQFRLEGLQALARIPQGRRLHAVLWESAGSAMDRGLHPAAHVLQDAGVAASEAYGAPNLMSEALARRARIRLALHDTAAALHDLQRARLLAESVEDDNNRERALADVHWVEGLALTRSAPDSARRGFDAVIDYHALRGNRLNLAAASVDRARFDLSVADFESADSQLRSALAVLERAAASLTNPDDRLALARTARGLFDDLIRLHVWHRADVVTGLTMGEAARHFALGYGAGGPIADLDSRIGEIPEGTTVLSFALVGDSAAVWQLTRGSLSFRSLDGSAGRLRTVALALRTAARSARAQPELHGPAVALFEALFPHGLPPGHLVIVPDGPLNGVPFGALIDPSTGRFVLETNLVTVAPSLSAYLATLRREKHLAGVRPQRALLVGRPVAADGSNTLDGAAKEVERLAAHYPGSTRLMGQNASRAAVLSALDSTPVLHFAGHAVFDPVRPSASRLLLSPGAEGRRNDLAVGELDGLLSRSPRLVVLSACGSLSPSNVRGGGFWGLAQPFLTHGTSAVVGTLWEVPDQAVVPLVTEFHRRWLAGESGARALRGAGLALLRSDDTSLSAPRVWAAFQILGVVE